MAPQIAWAKATPLLVTALILTGCDENQFCKQEFSVAREVAACQLGAGRIAQKADRGGGLFPDESEAQRFCSQECSRSFSASGSFERNRELLACSLSCQTRVAYNRYKGEQERRKTEMEL